MEDQVLATDQEDPLVMYLIVRESLGMSIGKTAAQCAHAAQNIHINFNELEGNQIAGWLDKAGEVNLYLFRAWFKTFARKVVLKADEKEWLKLQNILRKDLDVMIIDAGLTELEPDTATVIGLFPMKKSSRDPLIKRLQVLK